MLAISGLFASPSLSHCKGSRGDDISVLGGDELNQTHSGRYIGGQSLRASAKTGLVVSGGVTEEKGQGRVVGIRSREEDRLIDGINWISSFKDC